MFRKGKSAKKHDNIRCGVKSVTINSTTFNSNCKSALATQKVHL